MLLTSSTMDDGFSKGNQRKSCIPLPMTMRKDLPAPPTEGLSLSASSRSNHHHRHQMVHQKQLGELVAVVERLSRLADELSLANVPTSSVAANWQPLSNESVRGDISADSTTTTRVSQAHHRSSSSRSRTDTVVCSLKN